jgi:glycosyltransferase involved in cell wall biosynthesis
MSENAGLRTLFLMHVGSNAGYAIRSMEELFWKAGLDLAGGDENRIHFGYRDLANGSPKFLQDKLKADFKNILVHDFRDRSAANLEKIANYVRKNQIDLVVPFDLDPVDPLVQAVKSAGARKVVTYWGAPVSGIMPAWRLAIKRARFALARSKVDSIIFESQAMVDSAVLGRGMPASMTDIVYLGVRTDVYRPAQSTYVHEKLGFDPARRGHMERRKGVHVIINAAIELLNRRGRKDLAFLICGNKPGEADEFEDMIVQAGLTENVKMGGYRPDLPQIFPSCYAGMIASTGWDSFTFSAVEMAACGIPVIASDLQGLSEAVLDGKTGLLFQAGQPGKLADAVERLLDTPGLAHSLGQAGRARVEAELSVEAQAAQFKAVLLKRLGGA